MLYYCRQPTMIDREPLQEDSPAAACHEGHGPRFIETEEGLTVLHYSRLASDRIRIPPMEGRGRRPTLSSDSLPAVPEVTMWPTQLTYDAYHDADFTLAPMNGVFQPSSGGKQEVFVTRSGQGDSQALITKSSTPRRMFRGGMFSAPSGLDYQDFAPEVSGFDEPGGLKCTETFADLVTRANAWLRQNPQLIVRSCETITSSTSRAVEVGDTESMVRESDVTQDGAQSYCFSALRLWVIPKEDSSNSSSSFSFTSSSPSYPSSGSLFCASSSSASTSASDGQRLSYLDCKPPLHSSGSLSRLVDYVNQTLMEHPLPGRIVTCETVSVPDFLFLDTGCLLWTESNRQQRKSIVFLRLFYIIGSITHLQTVGVKNIVPELIKGKYESFSGLIQRGILWAKKEKLPIRITNFKSYTMPCKNACSLEEEADRCSITWPEQHPTSPSHYASASVPSKRTLKQQQHYFQVLRLFFVRPHLITLDRTSDDAANLVRPYFVLNTGSCCRTSEAVRVDAERMSISCAVFSPAQTSATNNLHEATFERMRQTMLRIRSWTRTAGVNVHSVESYASPLFFYAPNHTLPELTYWAHPNVISLQRSKRKFLTHIRVYYEHSASEAPQVPKQIAPNAICPVPFAADPVQIERERKRRLKEGRWRKRKLHLLLSCIMTFAICIPAGGLFYLNAWQTEWGKA